MQKVANFFKNFLVGEQFAYSHTDFDISPRLRIYTVCNYYGSSVWTGSVLIGESFFSKGFTVVFGKKKFFTVGEKKIVFSKN